LCNRISCRSYYAIKLSGHEVYVFVLDYTGETKSIVRSYEAEPVDYQFSCIGLNPLSDFLNSIRLARKFREISPDMVLSYFSKPAVFGILSAVFAGVKFRVAMLKLML
jgi:hypothetical protein